MSPLAAEHELAQRFSLSRRQIAFLECIWEFGRVCFIADRHCRPGLGMLRDLVQLTRPVGEYADHLMDREAARCRLYQQIPSGKTKVVNGGPILIVVPRKSQTDDAQRQHRGRLRPRLISLYETGEESSKFLSVFAGRNKITPGLFIIGGGGPASRLKQRTEVGLRHWPICEAVG